MKVFFLISLLVFNPNAFGNLNFAEEPAPHESVHLEKSYGFAEESAELHQETFELSRLGPRWVCNIDGWFKGEGDSWWEASSESVSKCTSYKNNNRVACNNNLSCIQRY